MLGHVVGPGGLRLGFRGELRFSKYGAYVVALVVVGVLTEGLAILLGHLATFGGLLDRQADATALEVDIDNLDPQLLAGRDHLLGQVDVVARHLRNVDQAFYAVAHLDE